jgi:hypothetical protein
MTNGFAFLNSVDEIEAEGLKSKLETPSENVLLVDVREV